MREDHSYFGLDINKVNNDYLIVKTIIKEGSQYPNTVDALCMEAEKGNLFALYELGNIYISGRCVDQNDEVAMNYYEKLINTDIALKINSLLWDEGGVIGGIRSDVPAIDLTAILSIEDWKVSSMIGDACIKLGYYYKYGAKKETAEWYFKTALSHGYNCLDDIKELSEKNFLKSENQTQVLLNTNDCIQIRRDLIKDFGEENWNKINDNSKLSLITSIFCYNQLCNLNKENRDLIDFSAVVMPVSKALEEELKSRFGIKYLEFCKSTYPDCNDYIRINNLCSNDAFKIRDNILYKKNNKYYYKQNINGFTLGSFEFTFGIPGFKDKKDSSIKPDKSGIIFCKDRLFKSQFKGTDDIESFLINLRNELFSLRRLRNDAAHGGKIVSYSDATNCINVIMFVKKILNNIIDHCVF